MYVCRATYTQGKRTCSHAVNMERAIATEGMRHLEAERCASQYVCSVHVPLRIFNGMISLLSLVASIFLTSLSMQAQPMPRLSITDYVVSDTSKYESFRLKVINESDSIVVITRAQPSCGCILVTVQRTLCLRNEPGDIYVAVTSSKVSSLQPITVDVYTNRNPDVPLRLSIRKADPKEAVLHADSTHAIQPATAPQSPAPTVPEGKPHKRRQKK